ncbi:MAG: glycerol-3-phosphate 1-O-acyltransferase PlsY [Lachnospiraceae bacterium]|nr:glycerol-3-phosphate 1-O-acyltransferase PlsY [Lachnospiraceae bacterium]
MTMRIVCLVTGYIFGLFQTSYILGKMHGIDIRDYGSGNAGTTNMLRTMGTRAGLITFFGDVLKTIAAVLVCLAIFYRSDVNPEMLQLIKIYASAGAILGHNFPFYLGFRGGKGIACTAGWIITMDPYMVLIGLIVFFGIFFTTHYVSLGSIVLYITFLIEVIIMGALRLGTFRNITTPVAIECAIVTALLCGMAIYRHRENIVRLIQHNEKKTYLTKKSGDQEGK